ncbi:MAG: nucleoside triphosphate pyrophosphohydrolase [Thermodesulfobacteriota bacterium]
MTNTKDKTERTNLSELVAIMARLRSEDGCPWDREQTIESLVPFVIEEAYEVVAAIESGETAAIKDELGDLLLQVVFISQMASEEGSFDIRDVITNTVEKMIRRHPHVFEDAEAETPEDVLKHWAAIKEQEEKDKKEGAKSGGGYLSGVPINFPALMGAEKISKKAAKVGFDWSGVDEVLDKVDEELAEFREAIKTGSPEEAEEELGDILFALVNVGRKARVNPEHALRKTIAKFVTRFHYIERELKNKGSGLADASLKEMEELWNEAKRK